jgi:signal transduction histidine kinase
VLAPAWGLLTGCAGAAAPGGAMPGLQTGLQAGLQLGLALSVCALAAGLAFLGYRLGQARERQQQQALMAQAAQAAAEAGAATTRALSAASEKERSLREALRQAEALQAGWRWQTDASHQLLALHPPATSDGNTLAGGPGSNAASGPGGNEPAEPAAAAAALSSALAQALPALLQAQRPLAETRLHTPADGSGWRLRAEPCFDAQGHFQGFQGAAWPTATEDALAAADRHVGALLQALPLPLLLARPSAAGTGEAVQHRTAPSPGDWQLTRLNPAAQRLLPAARPGQSLAECLAAWPGTLAALTQALSGLAAGETIEAGGWRLSGLCAPAPGMPSLLVCATAPALAPTAVETTAPQAGASPAGISDQSGESDQFSFTLSHDLRAPIRVVEGFTRIVKEDYGRLLDRVGNDHLDRVLGATARMNLMIDALLTLARLSSQPLARQPVNLTQLAHYVTDELKRQHPERHAEVFIESGLAAVGDPTLLRLVLENLLGNAWKYSARSARTHIEFRCETVDGRAAFVVRDQGAGFDMRSADRLFGLFQRLHSTNDFPGTGVGLASVRRIVRRHGGDIWAVAEPGRGASFHFTLTA